MRYYCVFLLAWVIGSTAYAQSTRFIVDIVPIDLPYQNQSAQLYSQHNCGNPKCGLKSAVWAFGSPSMRQTTAISKSFHEAVNYGVHAVWNRRPTDDPLRKLVNGGGEAVTSLFATLIASYLPFGNGWAHEEFHRNALTLGNVYSYNDIYKFNLSAEFINVSKVIDQDLVDFKKNNPPGYVRASEAGIEGEYQLIAGMQKDAFFYDLKHGSTAPIMYWITTIGTTSYVRLCANLSADTITNDINKKETTIPVRDWVGLDFTAWVYDLYRPNEPYADRGIHPSSVGINRYRRYSDLTPDMQAYLKTMGNRQLLNYVSPYLLGIRRIRLGKEMWGNIALRHYLTSFGDDINVDLFFKHRNNNVYAVLHRYSNNNQGFGGLEVQLADKPLRIKKLPMTLSLRAMAWSQPENQSFFARKGTLGGLVGIQVRPSGANVWQPYLEAEAKTAGWVAGHPFLNRNLSIRAGVMAFVR